MTKKLYPHFNPEAHKIESKIATVRTSHHCKYNINYHIIWIPKYRKQILTGKVVEVLKVIIEAEHSTGVSPVECSASNKKISVDDYVVATQNINDIDKRSVGLVKNMSGSEITVFFIGKDKTVKTNSSHVAFLDLTKTGKPYPKKICNICHKLKDDFTEFDVNQTDAKGRKTTRPSCTECRVAIDGDHFIPSEKRKLDAIEPKGVFTCPLCGKKSIVNVTANLVRDHDHVTGKAREWICDSCNTGLGRFKDNPKLLQKAIDYLKKYS